jgi:phage-related protein (TIGR01555 family)
MLTNLGTAFDKRTSTFFCADVVDWRRAMEIWRGDDLGKRIVELFPDEMVRKGFEINIHEDADGNEDSGGKKLSDKIKQHWRRLGVIEKLHQVLCYQRAYGGGAWLLGINDGQRDMSEPLGKKIISFDSITVLEPRELYPITYYGDPMHPKYGQPALYRMSPIQAGAARDEDVNKIPMSQLVHESRLVIFDGDRVSRLPMRNDLGNWGDSVFTPIVRVLTDFNVSWSSAGVLVSEFAAPVFKIEDLAKIMAENNKELFQARMQALAMSISTVRAALIDKNESYERQQTPVGGLAELLDRFSTRLAAAAGYPLSVLFGESPGGLNASGASGDQLRMFYDRVTFKQERTCVPALVKATEPLLLLEGGVPEEWSIDPCPLYQETAKEAAETRKTQMETDTGYMDRGVVTPMEVRRNRFEGAEPSLNTRVETADDPDPADLAEYAAEQGQTLPGATPQPTTGQQPSSGAAPVDIQKQAMNGAQISSLLEVLTAANTKQIARESAAAVLRLAFQLGDADAAALLGPKDFEPDKPDPSPSPFGGAPVPPGAPGKAPFPPKGNEPPKPDAPVPSDKPAEPEKPAA